MLYAFLSLNGSIDPSGGSSCRKPLITDLSKGGVRKSPAAAAASELPFPVAASLASLLTGLRLRWDSECRFEGDLERRSKREERLGSGSF